MYDCVRKLLVFVVVQVFELGISFFPSKGVVNVDIEKYSHSHCNTMCSQVVPLKYMDSPPGGKYMSLFSNLLIVHDIFLYLKNLAYRGGASDFMVTHTHGCPFCSWNTIWHGIYHS